MNSTDGRTCPWCGKRIRLIALDVDPVVCPRGRFGMVDPKPIHYRIGGGPPSRRSKVVVIVTEDGRCFRAWKDPSAPDVGFLSHPSRCESFPEEAYLRAIRAGTWDPLRTGRKRRALKASSR